MSTLNKFLDNVLGSVAVSSEFPFLSRKSSSALPIVLGAIGVAVVSGLAAVIISARTRTRALDVAKGTASRIQSQIGHVGIGQGGKQDRVTQPNGLAEGQQKVGSYRLLVRALIGPSPSRRPHHVRPVGALAQLLCDLWPRNAPLRAPRGARRRASRAPLPRAQCAPSRPTRTRPWTLSRVSTARTEQRDGVLLWTLLRRPAGAVRRAVRDRLEDVPHAYQSGTARAPPRARPGAPAPRLGA